VHAGTAAMTFIALFRVSMAGCCDAAALGIEAPAQPLELKRRGPVFCYKVASIWQSGVPQQCLTIDEYYFNGVLRRLQVCTWKLPAGSGDLLWSRQ
jgi:hypothetical protein